MPAYQEIPRPGRPKGTDQENILQMYRYQHTLAELLEAAINTIGNAGDRNIEETAKVEKVQREEKERLTQLKSVTRELNTTIQQTNVALNLKAPQKDVDSLKTQVSDATGKIASLEFSLNDLEVRAVLKAEYETDKNAMLTLISNAEESIAALGASHDGRIAALELYTSGLESRVVLLAEYEQNRYADLLLISNAEKSIAALEASHDGRIAALELYTSNLESRVVLVSEYDENRYADLQVISNAEESIAALEASYDGRIAALEVKATEQGTLIAAKADLILLDGYVKASELETDVIRVINSTTTWQLTASNITCGWITSTGTATLGGVDTEFVNAGLGRFDTLYAGDSAVASESWVEDQGYLTYSDLSNYATESWVIEQDYTTASDVALTLDNYIMKGELTRNSKRFITSVKVLEDADGIYGISTDSDVIYYYT